MLKLNLLAVSILIVFSACAQFDDRFYSPGKEWLPIDSLTYEEVNLYVEKDTLNLCVFKPSGKPLATILFFHGAGGNVSTYVPYFRHLVDGGYQVFAIDFRGYGKSTGTSTHLSIASDGQAFFNYVRKRKDVRKTKLIVYGISMGTQVAVRLASTNQKWISLLVLDGTISSFTDLAVAYAPEEQKKQVSIYVTSPYSAKEDIRRIGAVPKLFIASKTDSAVPYSQTETVFNQACEPRQLFLFEGDHLQVMETKRLELLKILEKYIE